MAIVRRTKTYAVCPACGQDAGCVDHLLGRSTYTLWYCDACGQRYKLTFSADGAVDIALAPGRKIVTLDVLKLAPQTKPVYFVVKGMRFEDHGPETRETVLDHKQFFYEEHSCPTNWLEPVMVYSDGDTDPHGLIEFADSRDEAEFPPEESWGPSPRDAAMVAFVEQQTKENT